VVQLDGAGRTSLRPGTFLSSVTVTGSLSRAVNWELDCHQGNGLAKIMSKSRYRCISWMALDELHSSNELHSLTGIFEEAQDGADFVQTLCRLCADLVQTWCRLGADFVQTWCRLCADFVQTLCRLCADFV